MLRVPMYPRAAPGWTPGEATYTIAQGSILGNDACRVIEVSRLERPGRVTYASMAAWFSGWPPATPVNTNMPSSRFAPEWARATLTIPPAPEPDPATDPLYRSVVASGWPMKALWNTYEPVRTRPAPPRGAFEVRLPSWICSNTDQNIRGLVHLPYSIVPAGFAINSLAAFAVWFTVFSTIARIRRSRRHKHGQCSKCGYDLTGSAHVADACPECGAAVASKPG